MFPHLALTGIVRPFSQRVKCGAINVATRIIHNMANRMPGVLTSLRSTSGAGAIPAHPPFYPFNTQKSVWNETGFIRRLRIGAHYCGEHFAGGWKGRPHTSWNLPGTCHDRFAARVSGCGSAGKHDDQDFCGRLRASRHDFIFYPSLRRDP